MTRAAALGLALVLAMAVPAQAAVTISGARFAERIDTDAGALTLAGAGVAKYRVFFTVYAAALYVPSGTSKAAVLGRDTPRRLTIEYFYEITPDELIQAANTVLDRQLSVSEREAIAEPLTRFHDLYRGVEEGDRYTMTYLPGEGTRLALNGEPLGTIEGAAFARAYYGIWLADKALSDRLRGDLTERLDGNG